jgi:hypothetical protein
MSTVRLDEEKLEALRSWGERLRQAGGEESAAVGRAILMLVEEIDRLHIELSHAHMQPSAGIPIETEPPTEDEEEPVASSLHGRLHGCFGAAQPPLWSSRYLPGKRTGRHRQKLGSPRCGGRSKSKHQPTGSDYGFGAIRPRDAAVALFRSCA